MSWFYKPTDREIYKIAIPAFVGYLAFILFDVTDIFWMGKAGTSAVAGFSSGGFLSWVMLSAMNATNVGANSLIAQAYGAKKGKLAKRLAHEAAWLSLAASLLFGLIVFFSREALFRFMGLTASTSLHANSYIVTYLIFYPAFYLCQLFGSIFNAYGDTKTNVIIMSSSVVINMLLDPILILGYGTGLPLGVKGAVLASSSATVCALITQFIYLRKRNYIAPLKVLLMLPSFRYAKAILGIGLPSACTAVTWSFVYPLMTPIISRFGMEPLAAIKVCFSMESFPYDLGMSFSMAMAALVGQAYGREDYKQVREIVKRGCQILSVLLVPMVLCFIFIPDKLGAMLNPDPNVVKHVKDYLFIIGLGELLLGWELLFQGAFNGLGLSKTYMAVLLPLTIVRLPVAYLMAITFGLGTIGIWFTVTVTTALKGSLLCLLFFKGKAVSNLLKPQMPESMPLNNKLQLIGKP